MPQTLPLILAGPVLRHTSPHMVCFWMATSRSCRVTMEIYDDHQQLIHRQLNTEEQHELAFGERCFLQLIEFSVDDPLPTERVLAYDMLFDDQERLTDHLPDLVYPGQTHPTFVIPHQLNHLLHGSCRKPHHPSADGLQEVDRLLERALDEPAERPDMLLMTGDQVYADDVAGPMLLAMHQLIDLLGLIKEDFSGATVNSASELYSDPNTFYHRFDLLPRCKANRTLLKLFFGGAEKPIFTSAGADNHLISLAEIIALYLLSWSPTCWSLVNVAAPPSGLSETDRQRYQLEYPIIASFADGLANVRRALAHLPTYMIFDDHDITDDWNLTRGWEEAAYEHPFSRRIIGNALLGYALCQGWGNAPSRFDTLLTTLKSNLQDHRLSEHNAMIDAVLNFEQWHYQIDTQPPVIVLDTRTQRWRSERAANKPSGLMDWESLTELQQTLLSLDRVVLVSPSPIFGVKLIETVQRIFTFFGQALLVDSENWMAHPGAANAILNVFRHRRTPQHFVILSGDVHYSFAYDITLRLRHHSPRILQVSASGIKNTFPEKLLVTFDYLNRVLYAPWSPLNWFTKRKNMKVQHRKPANTQGKTLLNRSGIGQVILAEKVDGIKVRVRCHDDVIEFE